jgi:hypothetical protein
MSNAKPGSVQTSGLRSSLAALAEAASHESRAAEPAGWTLPSGEDLLHYALNGGFLAPSILSAAGARTGLARPANLREARTLSAAPMRLKVLRQGSVVRASSLEEK